MTLAQAKWDMQIKTVHHLTPKEGKISWNLSSVRQKSYAHLSGNRQAPRKRQEN